MMAAEIRCRFNIKENSMKIIEEFGKTRLLFTVAVAVGCWLTAPLAANAQQGDNAVWGSSATIPSSAFIDASAFCSSAGKCGSGDDFCAVVNKALNQMQTSFPAGGVVDARAVVNTKTSGCTNTPWVGGGTGYNINTPSTLLLPAGTIFLGKTWILPNGTKIVGQGSGSPFNSSGLDSVTTLQAKSGFGSYMIQMGPNSSDSPLTACTSAAAGFCTGVAVENLALQGGESASGIINGQSQDMSYVRKVSMYQVGGIGLKVWANAPGSGQNSGPYSDITYDDGGLGGSNEECAELDTFTRGIHGLSCKSETNMVPAAVIVSSSNNSIKDVHIQGTSSTVGFTYGVEFTSTASSDVLFNISGGTGVQNLVYIEPSAQNISVMGVVSNGSTNSIFDSATTTTLTDAHIAMYVLGISALGGDAYTRFTTSPTTNSGAVTWGTGSSSPPPTPCAKGSLYSDTAGGTLSVCTGTSTWVQF
jgi:hypothetical protein